MPRANRFLAMSPGIDGWLLVMILALVILTPGIFVYAMPRYLRNLELLRTRGQLDLYRGAFVLFLYKALEIAIGLWLGLMLWLRRPKCVLHTKMFYLIRTIVLLALAPLGATLLNGGARSALTPQFTRLALAVTANSAVWFCYLTYSHRVRETYPDEFH